MHCEMIPIFISQNLLKGTVTPFESVNSLTNFQCLLAYRIKRDWRNLDQRELNRREVSVP
jgi:hypothetical protein